ncbi:uncharacterized protein Z520_06527 [Fonsecaea multimorphosa CBS 102226]|uniref:FAD/NAD(P)-binding domain-containing protein n=1 Tax=Fonsecaea multimorphosa CBS 102226 TaxID=1442371 RepID=A0A0D2K3J7_9EURO|nr:uncharacterized protein Z520_06527 [Fonsecaea multimorphosa CBS 102226]KIX97749.1 hypothetical protein Z520_06527 [Fonsecaea multimorphosa CBS 102226]OAL23769.1 hypothetical protein AYO22_06088 [Fonsecaea multimorphosa]
MANDSYDVVVVGAGFAGIYQLYKLLELGFSVKLIEKGSGPGGTWYWNRYPGAMSDTESFVYRYSWDVEDLKEYPWSRSYLRQQDVLAYLEHVVERYNLGKYMQFNTELLGADYDSVKNVWKVETDKGHFTSRYLITALGLLSRPNWPNIPKMQDYRGLKYHTAEFPKEYDLKNKKVGVIGCGSTGIQLVTTIAKDVQHLTCFIRRPQYSVPAADRAVTKEERDQLNENYENIWDQVKSSFTGMGFEESKISALSVSDEERQRIYQAAWERGNGLHFMFGTFNDLAVNEAANRTACDFIRNKIDSIVKDPEKARKLKPTELFARRPLCDTGYYETFNRDNVDIVDLKATPLEEFTATGLKTSDGVNHELDIVICATGFDAVDGSYKRLRIRGRDGKSLNDHWGTEPCSYLGCSIPGFPNFFMVNGPKSVFSNIPPAVEAHVEFISNLIAHAEERRRNTINGSSGERRVEVEATEKAEDDWDQVCDQVSTTNLFRQTDSWIFGTNVEGKKKSVLFFLGGLAAFRQHLHEVAEAGYKGFKPF